MTILVAKQHENSSKISQNRQIRQKRSKTLFFSLLVIPINFYQNWQNPLFLISRSQKPMRNCQNVKNPCSRQKARFILEKSKNRKRSKAPKMLGFQKQPFLSKSQFPVKKLRISQICHFTIFKHLKVCKKMHGQISKCQKSQKVQKWPFSSN